MTAAPENRLFLIDGMALLFRSFYAMSRAGLTSPDGAPVGAVFGFLKAVFKILREQKPSHFAVAWESGGKNFRHELYPLYKANRRETPQEIRSQIPLIQELIRGAGIPAFSMAGFEGDDVLATLATRFESLGDVYIVTSDKDLMQLVTDNVKIFSLKSADNYDIIGPQGVVDHFGITPSQVVDILSLAGDSSDNVPGVAGIGEKKAAALVLEYGSLDGIYAHLEQIADKRKKSALEAGRESAFLSRELVIVNRDIPLQVDEADLRFDAGSFLRNEAFRKRVEGLRMSSLARSLLEWAQEFAPAKVAPAKAAPAKPVAPKVDAPLPQTIFEFALPSSLQEPSSGEESPTEELGEAQHDGAGNLILVRRPWGERRYHMVRDRQALKTLCERIAAPTTEVFSFDTETTGLDIIEDIPIGASFSFEEGEAFYVPAHKSYEGKEGGIEFLAAEAWQALNEAFLARKALAVAHNLKFDFHQLSNVSVDVGAAPLACSMVAAWLVDAGMGGYGLDAQSLSLLGLAKIPTSRLIGKGTGRTTMLDVPLEELVDYACEDADATRRIWLKLAETMNGLDLSSLFFEMEMPLLRVLVTMERAGVHVDFGYLETLGREVKETLRMLEMRIYELAGTTFNIGSPKQLGNVLFEQLKVHEALGYKGKLAKTTLGFKTDAGVLEQFAEHPVVSLVMDYRELSKLLGTYIDVLPRLVKKGTGRIHTDFHQTGTATGRLSSTGPNLQNIPVRSEFGKKVRRAFTVSDPGNVLTVADYSQIELRILAHLAQDSAMIAAFQAGADIHRETAAKIHGKAPEDITASERGAAKAINFGLLYGMGAQRLAKEQKISLSEAKKFIEKYFASFYGLRSWFDSCRAEAHETGMVSTFFGRRRSLPELRSSNMGAVRSAENMAINTPVQGTAADIMKLGMIRVAQALAKEGLATRLLLQVHDEIVLEGPAGEADAVARLVKESLENVVTFSVPLLAEVGQGVNWLSAK